MMTTMITAIDSQEIQLSLQPSPTTGQTLAKTVDDKLRDVNERIVICTRIMGAARQNIVVPSSAPTPYLSSAEKNDGGESTEAHVGARLETNSIGQKSPSQAGDEIGQNNDGNDSIPMDLLQGRHHLADLDLQEEFDAATAIPDHNEL
ncbi:hypothetical protein BGZ97_002775 [Linnemannia gamsii]|uniref:Uncharacterized protein n=1 Tax=Linnemannia gamsii TaxID=64522 RepID=A0A9P6QYA0_9FUNG|nr:hypothetical protein BGZ97_002775 [Linnemannia gamsii]